MALVCGGAAATHGAIVLSFAGSLSTTMAVGNCHISLYVNCDPLADPSNPGTYVHLPPLPGLEFPASAEVSLSEGVLSFDYRAGRLEDEPRWSNSLELGGLELHDLRNPGGWPSEPRSEHIVRGRVPLWMPLVVTSCYPLFWFGRGSLRAAIRRRRRRSGLCIQCGYNLTGNASDRCPECGEPVSATPPTGQKSG